MFFQMFLLLDLVFVRVQSYRHFIYLDDIPVFRSLIRRSFVVMYADDILLIAPSVSELQRLFQACEMRAKQFRHVY